MLKFTNVILFEECVLDEIAKEAVFDMNCRNINGDD